MMLYKKVKAIVRSSDGNTNFFNIVAGVFQGDTYIYFTLLKLRTMNM